jgi:hypothetical protein
MQVSTVNRLLSREPGGDARQDEDLGKVYTSLQTIGGALRVRRFAPDCLTSFAPAIYHLQW